MHCIMLRVKVPEPYSTTSQGTANTAIAVLLGLIVKSRSHPASLTPTPTPVTASGLRVNPLTLTLNPAVPRKVPSHTYHTYTYTLYNILDLLVHIHRVQG